MQYLEKFILIGSLIATVAGCYVERRSPRYAHRTCSDGWYWDGHRCHRHHRR